jgi:hypothetical protein
MQSMDAFLKSFVKHAKRLIDNGKGSGAVGGKCFEKELESGRQLLVVSHRSAYLFFLLSFGGLPAPWHCG